MFHARSDDVHPLVVGALRAIRLRRSERALLVLGFEVADHRLGLVVEGGDDLDGGLFRVVKSQAAEREIDDVMTVPRSRPG
jgi:hypothetical protein